MLLALVAAGLSVGLALGSIARALGSMVVLALVLRLLFRPSLVRHYAMRLMDWIAGR